VEHLNEKNHAFKQNRGRLSHFVLLSAAVCSQDHQMTWRSQLRVIAVLCIASRCLGAQAPKAPKTESSRFDERLKALEQNIDFLEHRLARRIDDLAWHQQLRDVASVDRVRYTAPPARYVPNPTGQGASNEVIISASTFIPKRPTEGKLPLLVLVHGGVHGSFNADEELHIVRELLEQGYAIIAPDYRGSSGYDREFWEMIDYGGLEVADVFAAREWMIANDSRIDAERVGIMGWSHGGLITLMNIFEHPKAYRVAYAGVPVTDLVARMGYKGQGYRELFSAKYHIGKSAEEDVKEYRRRSPVWNAEKLQTPLLIHGNTNDEDVNVLEVEALINALKAAGKQFESKIYTNAPGAHHFNRIDTPLARESRGEIYRFLAKHLNPPNPPK
jgi:dipeptidyl aminopeptidase/acylaminoacyl peptidase